MSERIATITRQTAETEVRVVVDLDGTGRADVETGLGFLDHMLDSLARHARLDLELRCVGDLQVDDHHSVEDCAITLGRALLEALGDKRGIRRFGHAYAPLDESLARTVIDLSGRPWPQIDLGLRREAIGNVACENLEHFFRSLATELRASLHIDVLRGENDHHRVEAAFKSLALALRAAIAVEDNQVRSTKGVLE